MHRFVVAALVVLAGCRDETRLVASHAPSCKARDCRDLGLTCGRAADGCGGILDCGGCSAAPPQTASPPLSLPLNPAQPACRPKTCEGACGLIEDGCGAEVDCGTCLPPGSTRWVHQFHSGWLHDLVTTPDGDVMVALGAGQTSKLARVDLSGVVEWERPDQDWLLGLALDPSRLEYVAWAPRDGLLERYLKRYSGDGTFLSSERCDDCWVPVFDRFGNRALQTQHSGGDFLEYTPGDGGAEWSAPMAIGFTNVAFAETGSVVVGVIGLPDETSLRKLSSAGAEIWRKDFPGGTLSFSSVAFGSDGTIAAAGILFEGSLTWAGTTLTAETDRTFLLVADTNGNPRWMSSLGHVGGPGVVVDASGNVAALAIEENCAGWLVSYFDRAGQLRWERRLAAGFCPDQVSISAIEFARTDVVLGGWISQPVDFGNGVVAPTGDWPNGVILRLVP
jgi:hypothetical protein